MWLRKVMNENLRGPNASKFAVVVISDCSPSVGRKPSSWFTGVFTPPVCPRPRCHLNLQ
eukprot:jgi/Botrbrau1/2860/Bobra.0036s0006.1